MKNKLLMITFLIFGFVLFNSYLYAQEEIIIDEVTVTLPSNPVPGNSVILDYSIPEGVNYQKVTWNNEKMFVYEKQVNKTIDLKESDEYTSGDDYRWNAVVCPKEGYAFPETINDLTFNVTGLDINDNSIVKSKSITQNGITCRGIEISFQSLPGTPNKFLTVPSVYTTSNINEEVKLDFKFSSDNEIKLQYKDGSSWIDIDTINAIGGQITEFTVPTETSATQKLYRVYYNDKKESEFTIIWVDPNKVINEVEVTLPKRPIIGGTITKDYSIPNNVNYTKITWNNEKMFVKLSGEDVNGVYEEGKSYIWSVIVCPKDGYSFPSAISDLNFKINGININDESYVYSHHLTVNATTCRGMEINFKPLENIDIVKPTLNIKTDNNKFTLTWDDQVYATKYLLYRSYDNKLWTKYKTLTTNSFVDKSLTYGQKYYYKLKVCDDNKCTKFSEIISKTAKPNKVKVSIKSAGTNNVKLTWDKVGTTGYVIYRSTDNKNWSLVKTITNNSTLEYNCKNLKANKIYYFYIRAYKSVSGKKVYGSYSEVVSTRTAPSKPSFSVKLKDYNAMNLVIGEAKGAKKYIVQKSLDGKTWSALEELTSPGTLAVSDLELGKTYYFAVKVCNSQNRCSGWVHANLKQTTKTPGFSLKTSSKKVTITMSKVNGATGYQIYRATSKNGKYEKVKEFSSEVELLEFVNKTTKGKTYYYKVRSFVLDENNARVYSPYSKIKSITSK